MAKSPSVLSLLSSPIIESIGELARQAAARAGADRERVLASLLVDARFQELLNLEQSLRAQRAERGEANRRDQAELLRVALLMVNAADRVAERLAGCPGLQEGYAVH